MRLRTMNTLRSRSMPVAPAGSPTNSCLKLGIAARDVAPRQPGVTGTSRHVRTVSPSSSTIVSIAAVALSRATASAGRKAIPTA